MKASEIIELIIERHENNDKTPINLYGGLYLDPMLDYSGKMDRKAYWGFSRKPFHKDRTVLRHFDRRIMNNSGKWNISNSLSGFLPCSKHQRHSESLRR